jgi:hypothetical protein
LRDPERIFLKMFTFFVNYRKMLTCWFENDIEGNSGILINQEIILESACSKKLYKLLILNEHDRRKFLEPKKDNET